MSNQPISRLTRRRFLQGTSAALTSGALLGSQSSVWGATASDATSEPLRVAVIGVRGRGKSLISGFANAPGAKLVALCDADRDELGKAVENFEKNHDDKLASFQNYQDVLASRDIDIVGIAVPNHWHALMTIHALQAGKHVYVEKPVCHSVWEGRKMVDAMHRYERLVSAGFQNRSDKGLRQAFPWIHDGNLGKITAVRGLCNRNRNSIGKVAAPIRPPSGLDYDLWLGPAADVPILRPRLHYDWHWDWNTGNGDMGNQGPHELDLIRWALGDPAHPSRIRSIGGRFHWNDGGNTPNMQVASFDFGDNIDVTFEVRNLHNEQRIGQFPQGPGVGIVVTCEGGEFRGGRGGGAAFDQQGKKIRDFPGDAGATHMARFVEAVSAQDSSLIPAPLESSYYSSCMSHLANISIQIGEHVNSGEVADRTSDSVAREVLRRYCHQMKLIGVNYAENPWQIGPELTFDPTAEKFTSGDHLAAANGLLKREYRQKYAVPEVV